MKKLSTEKMLETVDPCNLDLVQSEQFQPVSLNGFTASYNEALKAIKDKRIFKQKKLAL